MMFASPSLRPRPFQARIKPRPDGRFSFARDGEMAWLVNVPDDEGYLGDCVAWLPSNPGEWWMLEGRLPIFGLPEITFCNDMGADLFLVETPARYVELGTSGPWPGPTAVIVDWEARNSLRLWLSLVRGVRAETPTLARALRDVLDAAPARPRMRVKLEEAA